ncbi:nucleotide exchange factor GrpE [Candidatus Azambacteria bacterium]|nr:nucleotide exchange factor GrpE [Candidatus Azambacteria bacterium]
MDEENLKIEEQEKTQELSDIAKCQQERSEYLDLARTIKSEFVNYKKDEDKRIAKSKKFIKIDLIVKIILVLDSFEAAIGSQPVDNEWVKGIFKIKDQIKALLEKEGVKKIDLKLGDKFDPYLHESLGEMESDYEEGSIVEELRSGYQLEDLVLKPSQVRISKRK